jgi:hypothetical protein
VINFTLKLQCDSCARVQDIESTNGSFLPNIQLMLAGCGWSQFLNGPVLCTECSQNTQQVSRVASIYERILVGAHKEATVDDAAPTAKVISEPAPIVNGHNGNHVEVHRKRVSDEKMQEALSRFNGSVRKASKELGITGPTIYDRIKSGRVFQYRRLPPSPTEPESTSEDALTSFQSVQT